MNLTTYIDHEQSGVHTDERRHRSADMLRDAVRSLTAIKDGVKHPRAEAERVLLDMNIIAEEAV